MHQHSVYSGSPVKVNLAGPATMIACGDFHTVVLMATGEVVTFGEYKVHHVYSYYVSTHTHSMYVHVVVTHRKWGITSMYPVGTFIYVGWY